MTISQEADSLFQLDAAIRRPAITIVGNPGVEHVGAHFLRAAKALGLPAIVLDSREAYRANRWVAKANWWLRSRRPTRLEHFSSMVQSMSSGERGALLLTTGIAPVNRDALVRLGEAGICRCNFLTDDPWNPAHRARWFFDALPHYDVVFTPRKQNMSDLKTAGCRKVFYLPFAYCPEVHLGSPSDYTPGAETDVLFAGGADRDRLPWIQALCASRLRIALYGGYWDRIAETAPYSRGIVDIADLKRAVVNAKITLCLVRRANRDGNSMRSFEVPAAGGCMLTEDTEEHRELFGGEGEAVIYFNTIEEMQTKLQWLLERPAERQRLARAAHSRIVSGQHTYTDRLRIMLETSTNAL